MQVIIFSENPSDQASYQHYEVADVRQFLKEKFTRFPKTGRIYRETVAQVNDVTPQSEEEFNALAEIKETIFILIYPGDPVTIIIAVIAVIAIAAAIFFLKPKIPNTLKNQQAGSANNSLSDRQNQANLNGRIEDIAGKVRSTPSMIAYPYRFFQNNQEVEICYMCAGRGYMDISDVREGTTLTSQIGGSTVEIYDPFTSPNSGAPVQQIGPPITFPLRNVVPTGTVNGQTLDPPGGGGSFRSINTCAFNNVAGACSLDFDATQGGTPIDMTQYFTNGQTIIVTTGSYSTTGNPVINLSGTYVVTTVAARKLSLSNAAAVNSDWNVLASSYGGHIAAQSPSIVGAGNTIIGPFILDLVNRKYVIANVVALQGMYLDDGTNTYGTSVNVNIRCVPVDNADNPIGPPEDFNCFVGNSGSDKDQKASTKICVTTFTGRCQVSAWRITPKNTTFTGTVVDTVQWRDCYAAYDISTPHFGNVTTIYAVTFATANALAVQERRLNFDAQRKFPKYLGGGVFSVDLYPTSNAADILSGFALDQYNGNRTIAELDLDTPGSGLYPVVAAVQNYFGTEQCGEFNYTFDKTDLTWEEMVATIADAVFCIPYRRGNILKLSFEEQTENSKLLFNHRNIVPRTQIPNTTFGNQNDYDGVVFDFVNPADATTVNYYLPVDRSAKNAQQVSTIGIRNVLQLYFKAWRQWNKIRYQNFSVQFDALAEADICIIADRILVADVTRSGVQDGEVVSQSGLILTLSQDVDLSVSPPYSILLQLFDGSVDEIEITAGSASDQVILNRAPLLPLVSDDNMSLKTLYHIVSDDAPRKPACILVDKEPKDSYSLTMTAANYDDRYYQDDLDFVRGIITGTYSNGGIT